MSTEAHVHIISKADIGEHKTISLSTALPALKDGHVRIRSAIISLTNNNLSYAQLGSMLGWWDAYPVPSDLPAPYNDREAYGIVPAWGYAEVLESRIKGIEPENLLWGFWPTADLPVDLKLIAADAEMQWIEVSEARSGLMNLYQRYFQLAGDSRLEDMDASRIDRAALEAAVRPVWEAGYLLNHAIFGKAHVHPSGEGAWSESDADLSSAVVINLAASGKTARAFAEAVVNRREAVQTPLGLLAITSVSKASLVPEAAFQTKTVDYASMAEDETMGWIQAQQPKKVVIVDFGGQGDALSRLHEALSQKLSDVKIVVVGVGGSPKVRTAEDLGQWAQQNGGNPKFDRIRMNTSPIRDALIEIEGAEDYFYRVNMAWGGDGGFRDSSVISDLKLELGKGIDGDGGFEGGWTRTIAGNVGSNVALAYRV